MAKLRFTDGVVIDTSGPPRALELDDGWYAVGFGTLLPCDSKEEALEEVEKLTADNRVDKEDR